MLAFRGLLSLLVPRVCAVCGRTLTHAEPLLCLACNVELPRTGLHQVADFNEIHRRSAGKVNLGRAAAFIHYTAKGQYSRLITTGKYGNRPQVIERLADMYLDELPASFFRDIDVVLPVPMHPLKQLLRGYNQAAVLARAISRRTGIPVGDNLRARFHGKQTRRNRLQRFRNAAHTYAVRHGHELDGLNVLLVDDIITTGATTNACARAINMAAPTAVVHLLSLGLTR